MARRKSVLNTPAAPPTLEERRNSALAKSGAALSIFQRAADDLEASAVELEEVEASAAAEAQRLNALADQAFAEAEQQRAQANAIRALLGGAQN